MMLRIFLLFLIPGFLLVSRPTLAQDKTHAFFMAGDYASPNWEKLIFDNTKSGQKLTYAYKQRETGIQLKPIGKKRVAGQTVVLVRMAGISQPYLIRRDRAGQKLIMVSQDGQYKKTFTLGYEGPVNGIGTYCASCANEPADAFKLVDAYFASVR
jgi:hypothetical protein